MEKRYTPAANGQELQQQDVVDISAVAAEMDDRTIMELLRPAPYVSGSPTKAILPFGVYSSVVTQTGTVTGITGGVAVLPFRALVGSRDTSAHIGGQLNWQDIRTTVMVNGGSSYLTTLPLVANVSGNARWDLVYAAVAVDANAPTVSRYVKDPATKVIAPQTLVTFVNTTISVAAVTGTPAGSPTLPALPGDGAGVYNIPLAYVRVPNGFNAGSNVVARDIMAVAPMIPISRTMGGASSLMPSSASSSAADASILTPTQIAAWGNSNSARPSAFMPSDMVGMETIVHFVQAVGGAGTWSQASGSVVDDSRNWRNRLFLSYASANNGGSGTSPWAVGASYVNVASDSNLSGAPNAASSDLFMVMGQSFVDGTGGLPAGLAAVAPGGFNVVAYALNTAGTAGVYLYVDYADSKLKVFMVGSPGISCFFWVSSTTAYSNVS